MIFKGQVSKRNVYYILDKSLYDNLKCENHFKMKQLK